MKIGMRKPSLTKSLKARTTSKWKRQAKKAIIPGYGKKGVGWIKNPKKAMYNKVYHKTTFGLSDLFKSSKKKKRKVVTNKQQSILASNGKKQHTPKEHKEAGLVFMVLGAIFLFLFPPLGSLLLVTGFISYIIGYLTLKRENKKSKHVKNPHTRHRKNFECEDSTFHLASNGKDDKKIHLQFIISSTPFQLCGQAIEKRKDIL